MVTPADAPVVIAGAGPGGLTAAYLLTKRGERPVVLEADAVVGGISRTVVRDGWRFDLGGHRFFTKVDEVEALWHEILPEGDFMLRPRMSRIYYKGKFLDYPLRALNVLRNIALWEGVLIVLSYLWSRIHPPKDESNYENWLVKRFGWRLYRTFFKTYTEKVWGVPVADMPADWAAQRVKNLDLRKAVINSILPKRGQTDITTLIEEFQYPKYGPGMMWEVCADKVHAAGGILEMEARLTRITVEGGRAVAVTYTQGGSEHTVAASHVVSTMPMRELVHTVTPAPPPEVLAAADDLHYRDYLTVALVVPESRSFPDNWIYIHATDVEVGRIQNYGSWSPYLVKDGRTCLGLEYFVFEGDAMWNTPDEELHRAGHQGVDFARVGRPRRRGARLCGAGAQGLSVLRLQLQGQRRHHPQLARGERPQHPPRRAQRHAQVQQPGSLHVHGHVDGREHVWRLSRHLVGQRRRGVPRGGLDRTRRAGAPAACGGHGGHPRPWLNTRPRGARRWRPWMSLVAAGATYLAVGFVLWVHAWTEGASTHTLCGCGDPALFLWFFQWPATALAHGENPFFSTALFHPTGVNLLAQTSVTGLSLPLVPVTWIWGPVASLNVASTLVPALTAFTAFVVIRRWVPWTPAAFVGGLVYGFSPFVLTSLEYAHLMTAALMLLPLILAVLDEILVRQRHSVLGAGLVLGVLLFAQFFLSSELLAIAAVVVVVCLIALGGRRAGHRSGRAAAARAPRSPGAGHRRGRGRGAAGLAGLVRPGGPGPPLGPRLARHLEARGVPALELRDDRLPVPDGHLPRAGRVLGASARVGRLPGLGLPGRPGRRGAALLAGPTPLVLRFRFRPVPRLLVAGARPANGSRPGCSCGSRSSRT